MNQREPAAGAESEPLFREEAVREHLRGRTQGELLRISPAWSDWAFWVVFAALAGSALFLLLARVDHVVSAPAVVHERRVLDPNAVPGLEVVARFPGSASPHLLPQAPIRVRLDGTSFPPLELSITAVSPVADASGSAVLARASIPPAIDALASGLVPGTHAVAEVRAGRRSLLGEIFAGFGR
jgi:hypothetical protein